MAVHTVCIDTRESTDVRAFTTTPRKLPIFLLLNVTQCTSLCSSLHTSSDEHHFNLIIVKKPSQSSKDEKCPSDPHNFPEKMVEEVEQHWDCLVIGAGISGLDAAYHLKVFNMNKTRPILRDVSNKYLGQSERMSVAYNI